MNVNIKNITEIFHPNPPYVQVYYEAVANAIDAGADEISIDIIIDSFEKAETLLLTISDNGDGFIEKNYNNFKIIVESRSKKHKGLGRLVYLKYFNSVFIQSQYDQYERSFLFNIDYEGKCEVKKISEVKQGSKFEFTDFTGERIKSHAELKPEGLKDLLLNHFIIELYEKREAGESFKIDINLEVKNPKPEFSSDNQILTLSDVPEFKTIKFIDDKTLTLFPIEFTLHYYIQNDINVKKSALTALSIDNRTVSYKLIDDSNIPDGYQIIFIYKSDIFGIDFARQIPKFDKNINENLLKKILRKQIAFILEEEIPEIIETNKKIKETIQDNYSYLDGYIDTNDVGIIHKETVINEAQMKFAKEQTKILESENLTEEQYDQALEQSSRVLMNYIIYRNRIIDKLESTTPNDPEKILHNLIAPMGNKYPKNTYEEDIFCNNVWLIDDKFMSYSKVLSDKKMKEIIKEFSESGNGTQKEPDIVIILSDNDENPKIDIVVVELKKHNVEIKEKIYLWTQLRNRAVELVDYYGNKINRMWFYGITDVDAEFMSELDGMGYAPLFSKGEVYHKLEKIKPSWAEAFSKEHDKYVDMFIMNYETLIADARCRNETFLKILRENIKRIVENS